MSQAMRRNQAIKCDACGGDHDNADCPELKELVSLASATCWTARSETPRTDAKCLGKLLLQVDADFARLLEMENSVLCEFINREMKMVGGDPRIAELEKRIAALSNRPSSPD